MTLRSKIRGSARAAFLFAAFGLAAILILVVFFLLLPRYRVSSASMEKTLHMGEFVVVERFTTIGASCQHVRQLWQSA